MGFRGEALASISAVSELTLVTKHKDEQTGVLIRIKGGKKMEERKIAGNTGTTISADDLFFNVPARKKFLKTESTEYRHLLSTFFNYALSYPHIHFVLSHNRKTVYNLPSVEGENFNEELKPRIFDLFGKGVADDLIPIRYNSPVIQVQGFISHPRAAKSSGTHQLQFLNKRPIVDKTISRAIYDAYQGMIPKGKYPIFFLFLKINPELVDVNVHPRKSEVRFENPQEIYRATFSAAKAALEKGLQIETHECFRQFIPEKPSTSIGKKPPERSFSAYKSGTGRSTTPHGISDSILFTKQLLKGTSLTEPSPTFTSVEISPQAHQVFNEIIIVEKEDSLLFLDQHAAAERVTYEKLIDQIGKKKIETQPLLVPEIIDVSSVEHALLAEQKKLFMTLGIAIAPFGKNAFKIDEVPVLMAKSNFQKFFKEIISDLIDDENATSSKSFETVKDKIIATMACHGSIRAGMKLQPAEIDDLVTKLLQCDNPYSCPHGRPIVWEISKSDLERKFKRPG